MSDDNLVTTETQRADAADRASSAWRLRVAGAPWSVIAKQLGYANESNAYRAVKNYFGSVPSIDHEMLRGQARARGEHLWMRAFQQVEETGGSPAAIRAAVEVLRRHAALDGLDRPVRIDLHDPDADEFRRVIELAAVGAGLEVPVEADPFAPEFIIHADVVEDDSELG